MSNNSNEPLDYECCDEHEVSYMGACGLCLTEEINEMIADPKAISLVDKDFLKAVLSFIPAPTTSSDASELAKDDLLKNIESALEFGNESQCFISTSTLCKAQNEIVDLRYRLQKALNAPATSSDVTISRKDAAQIERFMRWYDANDGEAEWPEVEAYKNLKAAMEKSNGTM